MSAEPAADAWPGRGGWRDRELWLQEVLLRLIPRCGTQARREKRILNQRSLALIAVSAENFSFLIFNF